MHEGTSWSPLYFQAGQFDFTTGVYGLNSTPSLMINSSGNVGIGTTSPWTTLNTRGTSGAYAGTNNDGIMQLSDSTGNDRLEEGIVDGSYAWLQAVSPGVSTRNLVLQPAGNGNVGIGTTGPNAKLEVVGGTSTTIRVDNGSSSDYGAFWNDSWVHLASDWTSGQGMALSAQNGINIRPTYAGTTVTYFNTAAGNSYINGTGGNVGIGLTSPQASLDDNGGLLVRGVQYSSSGSAIEIQNIGSGVGTISMIANGATRAFGEMRMYGSPITFWPGGSQAVTILSGGNVGIGITNPGYTLHVVGSTMLQGSVYTAWGSGAQSWYVCAGSGTALTVSGPVCGSSDSRLKTNVADLASAEGLAAVMKLRPVTFRWKDIKQDRAEGGQIGLLAQEVDPVLPQLVARGGDTGITLADGTRQTIHNTLSVDYPKLSVSLVKAVQELKADNDNLRVHLDEAEASLQRSQATNDNEAAQIKTLTARLDALEAKRH